MRIKLIIFYRIRFRKDGENLRIGDNTYLKGTEINQIIISNLESVEESCDREIDYISPKLDNHPTDLNGLRQLDEDIYLFSMNKRQAIFTSKFKEDIKYIELEGISYAIGKSSITGFIWIYSLDKDKRITTDKDKITHLKIDNKYQVKYLKVKRFEKEKIGPFSTWEYLEIN